MLKFKLPEDRVFSICTFFAITVCIIAIYYSTANMLEKRYQNAVELVQLNKWYQAEQALRQVPNYKDVEVLNRYVWANIKLDVSSGAELERTHYATVLECLNEIPENYQGNFKDEISELKYKILQKSKLHDKMIYDYNYACDANNRLKSLNIGNKYLYFEEEYIEPVFYGL